MKTSLLGIWFLLVFPCLSMSGEVETVWSSDDLSIVKDRGSLLSVAETYKITLSEPAAKDLRYVLNTFVNEGAIASALRSRVRHPLGRFFIDLISYNVNSFKKELNKEGIIGGKGIAIDLWVPKAGAVMICGQPDVFGIQEKMSAVCWAVINPWSWRIKARV